MVARLKERYEREIRPALMKDMGYRNRNQTPRLDKIVINIGCGEAIQNAKALDVAVAELTTIAGQKPVVTKARKAIANFKLREGMPIGCMVTLRGSAPGQDAYRDIKKLASPVTVEGEAEHLEREEARDLLEAVNEQLGSETIQFYPGSGSRHLMVWVGGKLRAVCLDPREGAGRPIGDCLPSGDGAEMLRKLMDASLVILQDHPVNDQRREAGLKPIHCLWLWGQGRATRWPSLPPISKLSTIWSAKSTASSPYCSAMIQAARHSCSCVVSLTSIIGPSL